MLFELLGQIFAVASFDQVKAIFVDQHGLQLYPLLSGFFGNILENTLAERAWVRRQVEAFSVAAEFDAMNSTCHVKLRGGECGEL